MITLRPYQTQAITDIRREMTKHKAVLFQLSTGAGKTKTAASMIQSAQNKGSVVFFCCHRKNLIRQTSETFKEIGIDHSFIAAGHHTNPYAKTFLCSIDTLRNRLETSPIPKIIFLDEAHLCCSPSWSKIIEYYKAKGAWICALTATPERLDGKGLGMHFSAMVKGPSMKWLIENGYLSPYKIFAPDVPDLSGIETRNGDYAADQLAARFERDVVLIGNAIRHYRAHADGKRAIAYCVSVQHSKNVAAEFTEAGIPAAHVDGTTPPAEQERIFKAFARGEIKILCNCALISTGFDLAAQVGEDVVVECIIDLSPTQSVVLYLQKVGRGLRPDGTTHVIIDHAGNSDRHGPPNAERDWTLHGREKKKREKAAEPLIAVRQCPKCHWAFKPAPVCPSCKYEFPIQYRTVDHVDGELVEMTEEAFSKKMKMQQGMADSVEDLAKVGISRGMQPGKAVKWARIVMAARKKKRARKT